MTRGSFDYVVMTAAITRPELHDAVFPAYLDLIGSARVKWLINVDDVGTGRSVEETVANLTRMLTVTNIAVEFLPPGREGCFLHAAGRLAAGAGELLNECRTGLLWLEDDWQRRPGHYVTGGLSDLRQRLSRNREGGRLLRCPGPRREAGTARAP